MQASKQLFRCYPFPDPKERKGSGGFSDLAAIEADSALAREIDRIGAPWAGPMLIFDCETLTGAKDGQGLRFGCFMERGCKYAERVELAAKGKLTRRKLDECWNVGIFYEPSNCTTQEINVLCRCADQAGIELYTREEFVKRILFRNHYVKWADKWEDRLREPCYVIGHNLPFDLGALAIHCGLAEKDLYGGLSLVMAGGEHAETEAAFEARVQRAIEADKPLKPKSRGGYEHRIALKKIGFGKHLYRASKQMNGSRVNDAGETKPNMMEMVHCLDTQTLARALLGPGASSMKALLKRLNVPKRHRKGVADYHGEITPAYVSYCLDDVRNTWQIVKAGRELYAQQGLSTPMHKLYSEASLAKAYFKAFGIVGFNQLNPRFDYRVLGCFMESYYGGQSDCRIRHCIVEVIHCDFKSQYPTVNILMGLQELFIAEQIGVKRDDPAARRFLETVELEDLQRKETWKKLRGVALIAPDDDLLPFRTLYGEENKDGSLNVNIGINRVISACSAWYTFADVIKSKLLTGRAPKVLKTLELFPIGRQKTEIVKLFGEVEVDLREDDFFQAVIDKRIDAQNELKDPLTPEERKAFLDSFQNGLEVAANGGSYGVPNEFIVDDHLEEVPTTVYFGGGEARIKARKHDIGVDGDTVISDYKAEKAGQFYHPLGVLIPAAGRLLLGIAERLAVDRGLQYAFCDTDSMAFSDYYRKYPRAQFREKVQEITGWFQPLNPYKHDVRLFGFEDVNYKLKDRKSGEIVKGVWEPLYCLAVSSKRYCLFNIDRQGNPILRKASAHGLGDVMLPTEYKARFEHVAAPKKTKREMQDDPHDVNTRKHAKLIAGSAAPMFLDMWYAAILELQEKGNLDKIDDVICKWPELDAPQHSQTSLSTRDAWLNYQNLPNRRAFQFFETLPPPMIDYTEARLGYDPNPNAPPRTGAGDIMFAEIKEAETASLYTNFSRPFEVDYDHLYRRDTNELIKPYLDNCMRLTTIADRVAGYFAHEEAKSEGGGGQGLLERKCVIGLTKAWIGKESHPLADYDDTPDRESLEYYKVEVEIVEGGVNPDLIVPAGISEVAAAARIDESALVNVVFSNQTALRPDLMARLKRAIAVDADGRVQAVKVPVTRQETAQERVERLLKKNTKFRELGKFIHGMREAEGKDQITHTQILKDLDLVLFRSPAKYLTLVEIETCAKKFYGIEARLEAKADRKARLTEYVKATADAADKARSRRDKGRNKRRFNEIRRIAEHWGLPEIKQAKSVRCAHLIEKNLMSKAEKGIKAKRIVCSPHLSNPTRSAGLA